MLEGGSRCRGHLEIFRILDMFEELVDAFLEGVLGVPEDVVNSRVPQA